MKVEDQNEEATESAVAYPAYDLAEALRVGEAVRDLGGGNAPISRTLIAKQLKYAESGPSFFQRVAAARSFGIIDGRGSYRLSALGRQYFYPTAENAKQEAAIKMLTYPKSFGILALQLEGQKLPSIEMLGNIMHSKAFVPTSKKDALAGCFIRSAKAIGVLDSGGFLHCQSLLDAASPPKSTVGQIPLRPEPSSYPVDKVPKVFSDQEEHSLFLDKEKTRKFTINSPLFLTRAEYDRICGWIKVSLIVEDDKKNEGI